MPKKLIAIFFAAFLLVATIVHADTQNISVSGTVAPRASDFQTAVSNDTTGTVPQYTTVTYTITYGTHLLYADNIKVEASWYQGTVSGDSSPSVDGMDYVTGSASKGYNNTTPVVDLTNQKIDWTINSFPANTSNQTVTFQLHLNGSYTGASTVDFPVSVRLFATGFTTSDQTTHVTYQYDASITPTPSPTPTSTPTPTPTPLPTSTPTPGPSSSSSSGSSLSSEPTATPTPSPTPTSTSAPKPAIPLFSNVSILNLTSDMADIGYIVTEQGTVSFVYGTSPTNLGNLQTSSNPGYGVFHIENLIPQHTYYFQLSLGSDATEIFSFITPPVSQIPELIKTSLIIAADNDILYSANLQSNVAQNPESALYNIPFIAVSPNASYSLSFQITKTQHIKSVQVLLQHTNVLGLATAALAQALQQYPYVYTASSKGNGVYTANIDNTLPPGNYNMFLVIRDAEGNISTEQVSTVHILHPFSVFNKKTKQPIEDVQITLYRLSNGTYNIVNDLGITNPLYTTGMGTIDQQLLTGKYKAVFSRVGYASTTVYFGVNTSPTDDYPTVYMQPVPITLGAVVDYYWNTLLDWRALNATYYDQLRSSYRFFDLIGLVVIFCSVILCFLLFLLKTRMHIKQIPYYFHHHGLKFFGKPSPYLSGKVLGKDALRLSGVTVYAIDKKTDHVVGQTTTNAAGGFLFRLDTKRSYFVSAMKQGYDPLEKMPYEENMVITLKQNPEGIHILKSPVTIFLDMVVLGFEFTLFFSFLLEIVFFPAFGFGKTAPFMIASVTNLLLWFFYLKEKRS